MEKLAHTILLVLALLWLATMVLGMVTVPPYGLLGLLGLFAVGLLFVKAHLDVGKSCIRFKRLDELPKAIVRKALREAGRAVAGSR